jgi:hypothetical protein
MNPVDRKVLENEYQKNNLTVKTDMLVENMIKVARVLTNTEFMLKALRKLSDAMLEQYKVNMEGAVGGATITKAKLLEKLKEADRAADDKSRHLLSTVLTKFEEGAGFKTFQAVNGHPRIIQMTGLLSGKDFLNTVGAGHMAKDYVTVQHGVYSHRIQWYCLGVSGELGENLGNLFKQFQEGIAWLLTFDRRNEHARAATGGDGTIDRFDFRTPEMLHAYLQMKDAGANCPLVAEYIQGKVAGISKDKSWQLVRMAVAARKLFPAKKAQLDGWKKLDNKKLEQKLKDVLGAADHAKLKTFLTTGKEGIDGHNVLYPQADGTYGNEPQK